MQPSTSVNSTNQPSSVSYVSSYSAPPPNANSSEASPSSLPPDATQPAPQSRTSSVHHAHNHDRFVSTAPQTRSPEASQATPESYSTAPSSHDPLHPYSNPALPEDSPEFFNLSSSTEHYTVTLTSTPITHSTVTSATESLPNLNYSNGAVSSFLGLTRRDPHPTTASSNTVALTYTTYPSLFLTTFNSKITPIVRPGCHVSFLHRCYGPPVGIGEISVVVLVIGGHRREVLDTLDDVVENMKSWLPVWKKESYESGEGGGGTDYKWKTNEAWALKDEGLATR